jgi:diadenosine tetraphosphate (Ap4A) HIT family hydrolase
MSTIIHSRVALAEAGKHPSAIIRLKSGWVVMADTQPVEGYCLLLSNPVVEGLNALSESDRAQYCLDMIRVGDALLKIKGAARINYETWCNVDPALHTHIVPRYTSEPDIKRKLQVCRAYDANLARPFDAKTDGHFIETMRDFLMRFSGD